MIQKIKESLGLYRPTLKELQDKYNAIYKRQPKPERKIQNNIGFRYTIEDVSSYKHYK